MANNKVQTSVIIAEKEQLFFKEAEFDFDALPPDIITMGPIGPGAPMRNIASRLFKIQNIDESIEVEAYPTRDRAIMFNAWITKNISYKIAKQISKKSDFSIIEDKNDTQLGSNYSNDMIGIGVKDIYGYPTVYGPVYHMTKVIDFGGIIELDKKLKDTDVIEVVSAEIVGSHDELLDPEPIYEQSSVATITIPMLVPIVKDPNDPPDITKPPYEIKMVQVQSNEYKEFDPKVNQYARLREKMCIKIKIRVIRKRVSCNDESFYVCKR